MVSAVIPIRHRRRFSREFKHQLVEQCQPGVSVAGIAMANGINPNQLQRWIREHRSSNHDLALPYEKPASLKLVPLSVEPLGAEDSMIEIQVERKGTMVRLRWPSSATASLTVLLTNWLK